LFLASERERERILAMWHLDVVDVVVVVVVVDVVVVVGLLVQRHFFSLSLSLVELSCQLPAKLQREREREKNDLSHGNLVSSVVVVNLAATHVSTSSAGTHEAGMGDSRSPFSDAQTN